LIPRAGMQLTVSRCTLGPSQRRVELIRAFLVANLSNTVTYLTSTAHHAVL